MSAFAQPFSYLDEPAPRAYVDDEPRARSRGTAREPSAPRKAFGARRSRPAKACRCEDRDFDEDDDDGDGVVRRVRRFASARNGAPSAALQWLFAFLVAFPLAMVLVIVAQTSSRVGRLEAYHRAGGMPPAGY